MKSADELQRRMDNTPFAAWLGVRVESSDKRGVTMHLSTRPEFQGSSLTKALHGGIIASLIDTAASYAIMAQTGRSVATIDLRVDYHRPGSSAIYRIEGSIVKLGRTIGTADAKILDDGDVLIASGRAVFMQLDCSPAGESWAW